MFGFRGAENDLKLGDLGVLVKELFAFRTLQRAVIFTGSKIVVAFPLPQVYLDLWVNLGHLGRTFHNDQLT